MLAVLGAETPGPMSRWSGPGRATQRKGLTGIVVIGRLRQPLSASAARQIADQASTQRGMGGNRCVTHCVTTVVLMDRQ
jgi:hypothetical protein